jgi:hypothetical protein
MNWLSNFIGGQAKKYTTAFIPKHRVDVEYDDSPIETGTTYCKLWLAEMHLAKDIEWGNKRYPIVHTAISYSYGGKEITIPCIADVDMLKKLTRRNLDRVVAANYELTPLFPYNRGTIAVRAGLFSVVDSNFLKTSIEVMEQLSSLLPATTEFSHMLKLTEPIGSGIAKLLNIEDHRLELGYSQTFAEAGSGGSNILQPGYFAVIRAEVNSLNTEELCVIRDCLYSGLPGDNNEFLQQNHPLAECSYMLFRIQAQKEQKWNAITEIAILVQNAQEALINNKRDDVEKYLLPAIKMAIIRSPDIAGEDRYPMMAKIQHTLKKIGLHSTLREGKIRSLHAIMQQPMPPVDTELETEFLDLQVLFTSYE